MLRHGTKACAETGDSLPEEPILAAILAHRESPGVDHEAATDDAGVNRKETLACEARKQLAGFSAAPPLEHAAPGLDGLPSAMDPIQGQVAREGVSRPLEQRGCDPIVGIEKQNPFARRFSNPGIPRSRWTLPPLVNQADSRILRGVLSGYDSCPVSRPVVDDDEFPPGFGLREHRVEGFRQRGLRVEGGDDDREGWGGSRGPRSGSRLH
jgi:hypothetical protein